MYKEKDIVTFYHGVKSYQYRISKNHLSNCSGPNNEIFDIIGFYVKDKIDFCTKAYGYQASSGACPCYKDNDMESATRLISAIKAKLKEVSLNIFKEGDYICTDNPKYTSYGKVMKILCVKTAKVQLMTKGHWSITDTRFATKEEILSSNYKEEYLKLIIKKEKHELQGKITTDREGIRSEPIRSRRRTLKTTSSVRLTGNAITAIQRKGKTGNSKISQTPIFVSRS